jgi:hypothetical protein
MCNYNGTNGIFNPSGSYISLNNFYVFTERTDTVNINCISTFEGVFQFTYEVNYGGGGICDNPDSQIQACQDPGSSYIDNQVFRMRYSRCRDVSTSQNKSKL